MATHKMLFKKLKSRRIHWIRIHVRKKTGSRSKMRWIRNTGVSRLGTGTIRKYRYRTYIGRYRTIFVLCVCVCAGCWNDYMATVFKLLHEEGVGEKEILALMASLEFTPG